MPMIDESSDLYAIWNRNLHIWLNEDLGFPAFRAWCTLHEFSCDDPFAQFPSLETAEALKAFHDEQYVPWLKRNEELLHTWALGDVVVEDHDVCI